MNQSNSIQPTVGRVDGDNLIFHQSWWNQFPLLLLMIILEGAITAFNVLYDEPRWTLMSLGGSGATVSWLPVMPLLLLAKVAFRIYNERFVVTPMYIIYVAGRLSWRVRSVRLEYNHIQEIEIHHTILQRVLSLGDLVITPIGGTDKNQIHVTGLAHPRAVKDVIREYKDRAPN